MKFYVVAVSLVCALLTLVFCAAHHAHAYQPFMTSAGKPFVWNLAALPNNTIKWKLDPLAPPVLRESVLATTQQWSDTTGGLVKFAEGDGGINFVWDTDGSKIYDLLFLAYTTFSADDKSFINKASIIVNAKAYTWHRGGYGGVGPVINGVRDANLDSVMLHELGHACGLDHSDKNPAAIVGTVGLNDLPTMNSVVYPGAETLHLDDETGIRTIYQVPPDAVIEPTFAISASPLTGARPLKSFFSVIGGDDTTEWDFGDGSTGMGTVASHKYTGLGTYLVLARCNGKIATTTVEVQKKAKRIKPKAKNYRGRYSSAGTGE